MNTMYKPKKQEKKKTTKYKETRPSPIIFKFLKTIEKEKHHQGSKRKETGYTQKTKRKIMSDFSPERVQVRSRWSGISGGLEEGVEWTSVPPHPHPHPSPSEMKGNGDAHRHADTGRLHPSRAHYKKCAGRAPRGRPLTPGGSLGLHEDRNGTCAGKYET